MATCESFLPILYLQLRCSRFFCTIRLFVLVLSNVIDPIGCVFGLVTISSCLLMQMMPKFNGCERSVLYFTKVFEAFEGYEVGKVILISSSNLETSPWLKTYMLAIVVLKSKLVTWYSHSAGESSFLLEIMVETKTRDR